jgi:hypothetical protein
MRDSTVQRKLDEVAKLTCQLTQEAHVRYGSNGFLFFETDGSCHLMDGDLDLSFTQRQGNIVMSSSEGSVMTYWPW